MTYSYIQFWERKLYVIHVYDYQENQVENIQKDETHPPQEDGKKKV